MSSKVRELMASGFGELRHEPTAKRIQAVLGGETIVDSTRAVLVWEPRRIVPSYAVPVEDVRGELVPADAVSAGPGDDVGVALADVTALRVLDPRIPFSVHSTAGEAVDLRAAGQVRPGAGFRPDDPDLAGLVILDFAAFDAWYEEDELNVAHPRDPFHRIDVLPSSRQVRLELDGQLLAVSSRPVLLFETMLPARYYLPRADITAELVPSPTRTWCAYKGQASYFSASVGGRLVPDIAWSYPDPQHDAARVRDLIAFFDERIDVTLDGERRARPGQRGDRAAPAAAAAVRARRHRRQHDVASDRRAAQLDLSRPRLRRPDPAAVLRVGALRPGPEPCVHAGQKQPEGHWSADKRGRAAGGADRQEQLRPADRERPRLHADQLHDPLVRGVMT